MSNNKAWLFLFFPFLLSASSDTNSVAFLKEYCLLKYPKSNLSKFIYVGIKRQELLLIENWKIIDSYPISTSVKGAGFEINSKKTPWGLHKVSQLIGKDVPVAGILQGKHYTGKISEIITQPISSGQDQITSRAIRLEGMEPGLNKGGNKDTYVREIYIHGTPEEGLIGTPSSHGCIRMKNIDVIALFNKCDLQLPILLLNN